MSIDTSHTLCAQCCKEFPREELAQVQEARVCTECRPVYLENLRRAHAEKSGRGYLFSAVTPEGGKITEYIEAPNLGAAKYVLEMRGYRDVVFHEDDISTATSRLFDRPNDEPVMDADDYLKVARGNSELYAFWLYLRNNAFLNVLMLAVLVAALIRGNPFHWSAILTYVYFAIIMAFYLLASLPLRRYNRLTAAVEWARWDEVEKMIERIRHGNQYALAKVPEFELDVRMAQVLAARGRVDEGLALLQKYEDDPAVEPFLYHSRRSAVYGTANDFESYLADTLKAAELAPSSGSMQVDVALAYILRMDNAEAAQIHLDKAREMALPDLAELWIHMIQGMIHLKQGNIQAADEELIEAEDTADALKNMPFMDSVKALIQSHRVIALAGLDRRDEARALFGDVRPWLMATDESDLIAKCEAAVA